ncbi:MAG: hypothetical protein WDW38_004491 [Sanguina aurantia]
MRVVAPPQETRRSLHILGYCLLIASCSLLALSHYTSLGSSIKAGVANTLGQESYMYQKDVLVMYIFAATDPEFYNNLNYFIREAVALDKDNLRMDYVIVVQKFGDASKLLDLPQLPSNAKYVLHANECYDWGTFGWLLDSGHVHVKRYKYFFFMNCSVRGPFMPAYARGRVHWTQPFLRRLVGNVKVVGPTISCEGSPINGDMQGKWRRNPHVQSYVVATDRVGLQVLIDDGKVFHCHNNRWNTIYYSELGSSNAILDAGYNLDCFMARYQGVNWRDKKNWDCNQRYSPQGENYYDGITLDPMEVMFVKVKSFTLQNEISFARKAQKYEAWQQATASYHENASVLATSEYADKPDKFKAPKVLEAKARGSACFDFTFYRAHNLDLFVLKSDKACWKHFVYFGQFEFRPHRFTCPMDYDRLAHFQ